MLKCKTFSYSLINFCCDTQFLIVVNARSRENYFTYDIVFTGQQDLGIWVLDWFDKITKNVICSPKIFYERTKQVQGVMKENWIEFGT